MVRENQSIKFEEGKVSETSDSCDWCGSGDIVRGIPVSQNADAAAVGLRYTAGLIFSGTEELLADLCMKCGTVVRFRVAKTDRKWDTSPMG